MIVNIKLNIQCESLEDLKEQYGEDKVEMAIEMFLREWLEEENQELGTIKVEHIEIKDF